jgi:outer membrane protein assembly factor BamB
MKRIMVLVVVASLGGMAFSRPPSDTWTEFRGPGGTGHADATGLPRDWSESQNVAWKTPIHGKGYSSPVVWGKQIWLTTGTPNGKELSVVCVDRESGKMLVDHKLFDVPKPDPKWEQYNSYASPSPVIEEGRVYLHFGCYGTVCLDTKAGKVVWARQDLACDHWRGAGSSPILFQNLLILHFDGYDVQYVVALDKKSGKTVWKVDRSHDKETTDGDQRKAFTTPTIIEVGGKAQMISVASKGVMSLDPMSGKEIWRVKFPGHSPACRPLFGHGLVYITTGAGKELLAIKPDGTGDVTASHVAWRTNKGVGHKPSPILVEELLFLVDDGGVATCIDAKTGQQDWQQRIGGKGYSASPLYADGAVYFFADDGIAVAVQAGREFKELGKGQLDGGKFFKATPAIVGNAIYLRTDTNLYRIEKR